MKIKIRHKTLSVPAGADSFIPKTASAAELLKAIYNSE
jgi:hypothetical protein